MPCFHRYHLVNANEAQSTVDSRLYACCTTIDMDMDVNRKQVTKELHHSHKAHVSFRKKVIQEGLRILSLKGGPVTFEK